MQRELKLWIQSEAEFQTDLPVWSHHLVDVAANLRDFKLTKIVQRLGNSRDGVAGGVFD